MAPFRAPQTASQDVWSGRLLLIAVVIGALHLGREVLAPLALALLLTIAAMPAVVFLERRGVPRLVSALLVLLFILGLLGLTGYLVVEQALSLAAMLPKYESVLRGKLLELGSGSGPIESVVALVDRLGTALAPADHSAT